MSDVVIKFDKKKLKQQAGKFEAEELEIEHDKNDKNWYRNGNFACWGITGNRKTVVDELAKRDKLGWKAILRSDSIIYFVRK